MVLEIGGFQVSHKGDVCTVEVMEETKDWVLGFHTL